MFLRNLICGMLAGAAALAASVLITTTGPQLAAAADASCGTSSTPVAAHYVVTTGPRLVSRISGVDLSGFDGVCDGDSAVLTLWGNPAGDPSVPLSGDTLLANLDSTLDPCTQSALRAPLTVQNGVLNLTMCPTGGAAGDVSIHDLTLVSLQVNGQTVPVVSSASASAPKAPSAPAPGGAGLLAFTGADLFLLFCAGVVTLIAGVALCVARRHRPASATTTGKERWS